MDDESTMAANDESTIAANDESAIAAILEFNKRFVAEDKGLPFRAEHKPRKHLAVVSCMETRLLTLLNAALDLENGDANLIKVAGAEVKHPYGTVMRSLLVAVHHLDVREIMIVAHTDCGAQHLSCSDMSDSMKHNGISDEAFKPALASGVDLDRWLEGFEDLEASVRRSVAVVQGHPLLPSYVRVRGFVMNTETGELSAVE